MAHWTEGLQALIEPHRRFPDAAAWSLKRGGIFQGSTLRTLGEPSTVRRVWEWFGAEIRDAAIEYDVPCELIVATICAETATGIGDPAQQRARMIAARREEPGYLSEVLTPARVSIGLMQTLLSTARISLHRPSLTGADLLHPQIAIQAGAAYLRQQYAHSEFDPPCVAAAYNAGGVYHDPTPANRWRMVCYPLGTGTHVTRWCGWFGDAMAVAAEPRRAQGTPSIAGQLDLRSGMSPPPSPTS